MRPRNVSAYLLPWESGYASSLTLLTFTLLRHYRVMCVVDLTYKTQLDTWHHVCVVGPLPMEDIARMADECMRDVDEDEDDSNLEDDEDLLVGVVFIYLCSYVRVCGRLDFKIVDKVGYLPNSSSCTSHPTHFI